MDRDRSGIIRDAFTVDITAWDRSTKLAVQPGSQSVPPSGTTGQVTLPSTGVLYLQIAGGIPPYTESVLFNPAPASPPPTGRKTQLSDDSQRLAQAPPVTSGSQESGALVISVTDSSLPTPQKYVNSQVHRHRLEQHDGYGAHPARAAVESQAALAAAPHYSPAPRKNIPVLVDISGEYDFSAQAQSAVPGGSPASGSNSLGITNTPAASTARRARRAASSISN